MQGQGGQISFHQFIILIKRFSLYVKLYWKIFIGFFIATSILSAATVVQPYLLKLLADKVLTAKNFAWLNIIFLGILASSIFKGVFTYIQGYLMALGGQGAIKRLRNDLYEHLQFMPLSFYDKSRVGDIMVRLTSDVGTMTDIFTSGFIALLNDMVVLVCSVAWMIYKDWTLTFLALIVSPFIALSLARFGKMIQHFSNSFQGKVSDLTSLIQESISGIKVVKSFTMEKYEAQRFAKTNEENYKIQMKVVQLMITQGPVVEILATLGIGIVIWYGSLGVIQGKFTVGDMMAFWGYMLLATNPLNRITNTYGNVRRGLVSAVRVFEIMDFPTEVKDTAHAKEIPQVKGSVEFKGVSFSYDKTNNILKDVNLTVHPGETVAIVGRNGAGKTTLVNLVARFYDADKGAVLVDGHDLRGIQLHSLRRQMGLVLQETILFSGTIYDNIAYGKLDAAEEEIIAAAKSANAHGFIMNLPDKYQTLVGERGVGLSGGQRQRIAIARAILRNPRILILDEATSSLDKESEAVVQDALEKLMSGRTTFVIAHHLSTIRRADKIIVLDKGEVAEVGTHDELLRRGGVYSCLYDDQLPEAV